MQGIFDTIKIDSYDVIAPNDLELRREDVYAAEYTSCTGKTIADKIGWKYADTTLEWDTLPEAQLNILTAISGPFTLAFTDSDGAQTETAIRLGFRNTATRFTDDNGDTVWRNVEMEVAFINVH